MNWAKWQKIDKNKNYITEVNSLIKALTKIIHKYHHEKEIYAFSKKLIQDTIVISSVKQHVLMMYLSDKSLPIQKRVKVIITQLKRSVKKVKLDDL